jgi:putative redox protein
MGTARVKWLEKLQFVGIDSSRHSVVMSSQDEQNATGMKPSELMLIALGGCTGYDVINILTKKRQHVTDLEITISGQQEPDPPWTFTHVHLIYRLRGRGLNEKAVRDAIELSKDKYCSVGATLAKAAEITFDYVIEEEEV